MKKPKKAAPKKAVPKKEAPEEAAKQDVPKETAPEQPPSKDGVSVGDKVKLKKAVDPAHVGLTGVVVEARDGLLGVKLDGVNEAGEPLPTLGCVSESDVE
jgi:hypothetical protein